MVDDNKWRRGRRTCVILLYQEIPLVHPVKIRVVLYQLKSVTITSRAYVTMSLIPQISLTLIFLVL